MTSTQHPIQRGIVVLVALLLVTTAVSSLSFVAVAASEEEPNDSQDAAQSIPTGEKVTGSTPSTNDEDWYVFTVDRGDTINISATVDAGDNRDKFQIRDKNGDRVASNGLSGTESGSVGTTATYTGVYYLRILPSGPTEYNFTVDTYRTDDFEPNEDQDNATRINLNTRRSGQTTIGDVDWFRFEVDRGDTINISATVDAGDNRDKFQIWNKNRDRVASNGLSGTESGSVGTTARYSGTYYLRILPSGPTEYNFTVDTYRTDDFEPNENLSQATPLFENPFTPTEARITIGDADYFDYRLDAGDTLRAEVGAAPDVTAEPKIRLFRTDGSADDNPTNVEAGTTETVELTAESAGVHTIGLLRRDVEAPVGDYNITFTVSGDPIGPPNDRFERPNPPIGNQDRANATDLAPDIYTDLGMVDDDRDVFAVGLQSNERVTATVNFTHAENDLRLELQDAAGQTVAQADTSTDNERLAVNATGTETHYLIVTGESGAAAEYDLNLTVTTVEEPESAVGRFDEDGDGGIDQRELLAALAVYDADASPDDPDAVNQRDLLELLAVYDADA